MIARWQEKEVISTLNNFRVVNLTGARHCGKTTLSNMLDLHNVRRYALDNNETRKAATSDPLGFVDRKDDETIVIDEIQKAPELLNAIKIRVDACNAKGQYLLTGSSNLHFVKAVSDSLAGRIGKVRLRTLAYGERIGGRGDFLDRAFARDFPTVISGVDKRAVIRFAAQSGYPEAMDLESRYRKKWFLEYLDNLLTKDIRDVTEIRKLDVLRKIAVWLLAHSSKFFDVSELAAKSGVSKATVDTYLSALKALYVFDEVPPWSKGDYSKIGKRSKYFASDAGLAINILGWSEESIYMDSDMSGKTIETWVYQNLASLVDVQGDCELSQYRDSKKREIDFIVERMDGAALGIEVKAGSSLSEEDFNHLKWFAKYLAKDNFTGVVLYSGEHTLRFGEGFYAVPLAALGT